MILPLLAMGCFLAPSRIQSTNGIVTKVTDEKITIDLTNVITWLKTKYDDVATQMNVRLERSSDYWTAELFNTSKFTYYDGFPIGGYYQFKIQIDYINQKGHKRYKGYTVTFRLPGPSQVIKPTIFYGYNTRVNMVVSGAPTVQVTGDDIRFFPMHDTVSYSLEDVNGEQETVTAQSSEEHTKIPKKLLGVWRVKADNGGEDVYISKPKLHVRGQTLSWDAIPGVNKFLIYHDSFYLETVTERRYKVREPGIYRVNAVVTVDGRVYKRGSQVKIGGDDD